VAVAFLVAGLAPDLRFRTVEAMRVESTPLRARPGSSLAATAPDLARAAGAMTSEAARHRRAGLDDPAPFRPISTASDAATGAVVDAGAVGGGEGSRPPADPGSPEEIETPEEIAAEATAADRLIGGDLSAAEFTAVGVTFAEPPPGPVYLRVRDDLGWSDWFELEAEPSEGPDPGAEGNGRVSTPPIWTGGADAYLVSLPAGSTAADPEVATVHRDTRTVRVDGVGEAGAAELPLPGATPASPRSAWGARPPKPGISKAPSIQYAVVHHTVNSNAYAAADVPGILRSIQAYHMDGNGWSDIGYNFLVDRFGRIWEGRAGSLSSAAVGAHVAGFNTGSVGIANIGTYQTASPSAAQVSATATIAAWRLAAYGVDSSGSVTVTAGADSGKYTTGTVVTIPRIVGHRDLGASSCPGNLLWNQLSSIRAQAALLGQSLTRPFGNVEGWVSAPGRFRIAGWVADPQTTAPVTVYVEVGPYRFSVLADRRRPDVGAAYPALGPDHGFDATFTVPAGRYRACVYGIDPQTGAGSTLRCGEVVTGGSPFGAMDATVTGTTLTVRGWAIDPDTTAPIPVLIDAGGRQRYVLADRRRDDLAASYPGFGVDHGYVATMTLPTGSTRVCAYGLNTGAGSDALLGCGTVVVK
jgi:hypothetical protein